LNRLESATIGERKATKTGGVAATPKKKYLFTMDKFKAAVVVFLIGIFLTACSSNSASYNLGFERGSSESFSQIVFYGSSSPQSQCSTLLNFSKDGSPNDGIDWENIDTGDFLKGCFDGYKAAHPAMDL
jgi:hypothetical protein